MKNLIRPAILLSSILCFQQVNSKEFPIFSQTTIDPRQLIQKSAEACQSVKTIEYTEDDISGQGERPPDIEATIRQARANTPSAGFLPGKFIVEGRTYKLGSNPEGFAYSYDGASLRLLDSAEKVVRVIKSPSPRMTGSLLASLGLVGIPQFTQDQPFKGLLDNGERFVYEGRRTVKGTPCHVIAVTQVIDHPTLGKQTSTARWFIGVEDNLPRGYEIGATRKFIQVVKVNAASVGMEYVVPTPTGYGEKLETGNEPKSRGLLSTGSVAPDWTLYDSRGTRHSSKEYRGRILLIDFWGTWCVPCRKTMPIIQSLHEKYKDQGVAVLGIAVADNEGDPIGYMRRNGFTYTLLLGGDETAALYRAEVLPTLYIIGRDGRIVHAEYGFREDAKDNLESIIGECLRTERK